MGRNPEFIVFNTQKQVRRKGREAFDKVQKSICVICLSKDVAPTFWAVDESLKKARKEGIAFRLIIEKPVSEKTFSEVIPQYNGLIEAKYLPSLPPVHLSFYDNTEVFIRTRTESNNGKFLVLWSNNSILMIIVRNYFELMWNAAKEK